MFKRFPCPKVQKFKTEKFSANVIAIKNFLLQFYIYDSNFRHKRRLNFNGTWCDNQSVLLKNACLANNKNIQFYAGFTLNAKHDPIVTWASYFRNTLSSLVPQRIVNSTYVGIKLKSTSCAFNFRSFYQRRRGFFRLPFPEAMMEFEARPSPRHQFIVLSLLPYGHAMINCHADYFNYFWSSSSLKIRLRAKSRSELNSGGWFLTLDDSLFGA